MAARLTRIILYVQDVERLAAFYRDAFGLAVVEQIPEEWAVLKAGACELALHRVGKAYRVDDPQEATCSSWRNPARNPRATHAGTVTAGAHRSRLSARCKKRILMP